MSGERNTNTPAVQGASQQLDQFKYEVANEMGLQLSAIFPPLIRGNVKRYRKHNVEIYPAFMSYLLRY